MPRVYLISLSVGLLIGALVERSYLSERITPTILGIITLSLALVYANEKRAIFEERISYKMRRLIGLSLVLGLALLWILALE